MIGGVNQMKRFCSSVLVGTLLVLLGCQQNDKLVGQLADLEKRQKASEDEIAALKSAQDSLRQDFDAEKFLRDYEQVAYLTPGSDGYSIVKFDLGYLTVLQLTPVDFIR